MPHQGHNHHAFHRFLNKRRSRRLVCVHPWTNLPTYSPTTCFTTDSQAVEKSARSLGVTTQRSQSLNRGDIRKGRLLDVPALNTLTPLVPLAAVLCFHGCSHATFPINRFPTALQLLNAASTCTLSETLFNNTFLRTHAPFRSFTFLLNVGTESLKTNVRVCVSQSQPHWPRTVASSLCLSHLTFEIILAHLISFVHVALACSVYLCVSAPNV